MIHVVASIEVKPGHRDEFIAAFHQLVPKVKAEEGCVDYGPTVDAQSGIDRQVPYRENTVTIIEQWQDLDCLKAHLTAPHMAEFRTKVQDLNLGATLQILESA